MGNKLGVNYTIFDGTELLEYSINQIKEHVDFICVVYQEYSYFGKKIDEYDLKKIFELKDKVGKNTRQYAAHGLSSR